MALREELPLAVSWVLAQRVMAMVVQAQFDAAESVMRPVYEVAVSERDDDITGGAALVLGEIALHRGDLIAALGWLGEAAAILRRRDLRHYLPWCLANLAQAAGQAGDAETARAAVDEAEQLRSPAVHVYDVLVGVGRAWAAAADGRLEQASSEALLASEAGAASSSRVLAAFALHEALRLGAEPTTVLPALTCAASGIRSPLAEAWLMHTLAARARDGSELDEAAIRFERLGTVLLAAEASTAAAEAHRRRGALRRALRSDARAEALLAACPGAVTPALGAASAGTGLTRREREVAMLAARGLANSEIADRLCVSVRTVEGHLMRAFTTLGVEHRSDLRSVLRVAPLENA